MHKAILAFNLPPIPATLDRLRVPENNWEELWIFIYTHGSHILSYGSRELKKYVGKKQKKKEKKKREVFWTHQSIVVDIVIEVVLNLSLCFFELDAYIALFKNNNNNYMLKKWADFF